MQWVLYNFFITKCAFIKNIFGGKMIKTKECKKVKGKNIKKNKELELVCLRILVC